MFAATSRWQCRKARSMKAAADVLGVPAQLWTEAQCKYKLGSAVFKVRHPHRLPLLLMRLQHAIAPSPVLC